MEDLTVYVEAEVRPTESEERVRRAIMNVFPSLEITLRGNALQATGKGDDSLIRFCEILRRERIRAASRSAMIEGIDRHSVTFCLNKQVAYAGHISFAYETAESPLGPIRVKIDSANPRELVNRLTSNTP